MDAKGDAVVKPSAIMAKRRPEPPVVAVAPAAAAVVAHTRLAGDDTSSGAVWATTPPQIKLTSRTEQNGVKRLTASAILGVFALRNMPQKTGSKTTLAVAAHSAIPEIDTEEAVVVVVAIVLPTNSLTSSGVMTTAASVEHVVKITDRATSAPAIKDTRFEAVPPGEHPTKHRPKKRACETALSVVPFNKSAFPTPKAVSGIMANWHTTPSGTARRFAGFARTAAKSSFCSVKPVPHMTAANMAVTVEPRLTHMSKSGRTKPKTAALSTKTGKAVVKRESQQSTRALLDDS